MRERKLDVVADGDALGQAVEEKPGFMGRDGEDDFDLFTLAVDAHNLRVEGIFRDGFERDRLAPACPLSRDERLTLMARRKRLAEIARRKREVAELGEQQNDKQSERVKQVPPRIGGAGPHGWPGWS